MAIFNNGLSGLLASQQMLNLTSQNIANMNTDGYTRQGGVLVSRAGDGGKLNAGNGVEVAQLFRISDEYLENALWSAHSQNSYDKQYQSLLTQAETVVGSESVSIAGGVDGLFTALSQATNSPESETARGQVINEAGVLADRFNQIFENISLQERQVIEQSEALIKSTNAMAANVADLNKKILDLESQGGNTNQLQDQRNLAIQELSKSLDLKINRLDNGYVSLTGPNGQPIVSGSKSATLSLSGTGIQATMSGLTFDINNPGGQLGGLQDYKNTFLVDLKTDLNAQAVSIADDINNQLAAGFDKNGNPGAPLFTYNPTAPGETISTTAIAPDELAFIGDDGFGNPVGGVGDNQNLQEILKLRPNFYDAFSSLIGDIGIESRQAQLMADSSANYLNDAKQRRDSVSAVNQDEEAVNLMKFNEAYQANAKVIGVSSDLFDTIMGMF